MPGRPYVLAEATWKTVEHTPYTVAVLPWGATEPHNYHLPYATDIIQCDHVAARPRAARGSGGRARWCSLPYPSACRRGSSTSSSR
jgi:creatinine amidohydrolase